MSAKVEPGTYQCKTTAATIYEAPSGAVMCRIALDIGLTGGICLIQKDGTLSERGFKDAAAILGIEGPWDWAAWECEPEAWAGHDVEAVVETLQGERGEFSSVKYLNVPGGGSAGLTKADAKSLAARYGAKTRALFGGAPVKPAAKPTPRPPMPAAKKQYTMEECWAKFLELHEGVEEHELYAQWDADIQSATGKSQNDCGPDEWSTFMEWLNNHPIRKSQRRSRTSSVLESTEQAEEDSLPF